MADITTLRTNIAANIQTISGLMTYSEWPGTFNAPGAIVVPTESDPEQTLGTVDLSIFFFEVLVAVLLAAPLDVAQRDLAAYVSNTGTKSVLAALSLDRTLGGLGSMFYRGWTRPDVEDINGVGYLGQRLTLEVWAR